VLTGSNFIAGRTSREGAVAYHAVDARSQETLPESFHDATWTEVRAAVDAASRVSCSYAEELRATRAAVLDGIASAIGDLGDALLDRIEVECGLPRARNVAERTRTVNQLRMFAEVVREGSWVDARLDSADLGRRPVARPSLRRMLVPLGPVAVFGASNFPQAFSVAGGDTASALAAGCPVVYKVHPGHPGVSELVGAAVDHAVTAAGAPPGTFSMLHGGQGHAVSELLVTDDGIEAVAFTGSFAAGTALMRLAAARARPVPVYAEMGSINPVVIGPAAYRAGGPAILDQLAASVTGGAGQLCTKPGLVIGGPEVAAGLAERLAGTGPGVMLSARLATSYAESVRVVSERPGVEILLAGPSPGSAALLSVPAADFVRDPALHAEMFGPAALVVVADSLAAITAVVGALPGQLTGTLHLSAAELDAAPELLAALARRVGRVLFGGVPTGVEVGPAQQHGGPFPATSDARSTSVGTAAITRFARPIAYQGFDERHLPPELRAGNPLGIRRLVDGEPE
jgi:2,5-dioxopentanoate dehydrogenase